MNKKYLVFILFFLRVLLAFGALEVQWFAPFFSGGGYCSEAISFVEALVQIQEENSQDQGQVPPFELQIANIASAFSLSFVQGLPQNTKDLIRQLFRKFTQTRNRKDWIQVSICHSVPFAWIPTEMTFKKCPPQRGPEFKTYSIGRTMFETDKVPEEWIDVINRMDEVWVTTNSQEGIFRRSGIKKKIVVIGEIVDADFFNPQKDGLKPYDFDALFQDSKHPVSYFFLSIFEWAERKGWRFLLKAFLSEFDNNDGAGLVILTVPTYKSISVEEIISDFIDSEFPNKDRDTLAPIRLIPFGIPTIQMPSVYLAANAFVLPSRGEGWGRPITEAMSMELPVIATYWSGPEEFMDQFNSFPLDIDGFDEVENEPFKGHIWARPSVEHLRKLMREVLSNPEAGKRKGKIARANMIEKYCPKCVVERILNRFRDIHANYGNMSVKDEL